MNPSLRPLTPSPASDARANRAPLRRIFLTLLLLSIPLLTAFQPKPKRVLILGDSHLVGQFGEHLHRHIHSAGKCDVLSIAICAGGSRNFVGGLRNLACGYRIRESFVSDGATGAVTVLSEAKKAEKELVGKKLYGGYLSGVLNVWKPDLTIIALGSNWINAHGELMDTLRAYRTTMPVVWIGPFLRQGFKVRLKEIRKVIDKDIHGVFIRSDDIVGHDTISTTHFYGKEAKNWAYQIAARIEPHLEKMLSDSLRRGAEADSSFDWR